MLAAQRIAGDRTSRQVDYAGGSAPILYLQPEHDPLAHVEDAHEFKRALGERVTVIVIDNASHAAIAEQPEAISRALIDFAGGSGRAERRRRSDSHPLRQRVTRSESDRRRCPAQELTGQARPDRVSCPRKTAREPAVFVP